MQIVSKKISTTQWLGKFLHINKWLRTSDPVKDSLINLPLGHGSSMVRPTQALISTYSTQPLHLYFSCDLGIQAIDLSPHGLSLIPSNGRLFADRYTIADDHSRWLWAPPIRPLGSKYPFFFPYYCSSLFFLLFFRLFLPCPLLLLSRCCCCFYSLIRTVLNIIFIITPYLYFYFYFCHFIISISFHFPSYLSLFISLPIYYYRNMYNIFSLCRVFILIIFRVFFIIYLFSFSFLLARVGRQARQPVHIFTYSPNLS